jgi:hypothetical protein
MSEQSRKFTGLVSPVPAVDPILAKIKEKYPAAGRDGIVGHVSVLYPFVQLEAMTLETTDWLSAYINSKPPLKVGLADVVSTTGFVYFEVLELASLVEDLRAHWPRIVPYSGRFGSNPATHITLAMGVDKRDAGEIMALVRDFLPLSFVVDQIWLVSFDDKWSLAHRFLFQTGK